MEFILGAFVFMVGIFVGAALVKGSQRNNTDEE